MAFNVSWKQKLTNKQLYLDLPPVTDKIRRRRMRLAGHLVRHNDEIASELVLWEPTDGHASRGRRRVSYIDNLLDDTGCDNKVELKSLMMDRKEWRKRVHDDERPGGRQK